MRFLSTCLLGFAGLLPAVAAAQAPISFVLKGQLDRRLGAPAQVYLFRDGLARDSAAVTAGRFELKGTVTAPERAYLVLSPRGLQYETFPYADTRYGFYLEKGTVTFTSPDSLKNARVVGGPLTTDWLQLEQSKAGIVQQLKALSHEYAAASPAQRQEPAFQQARALRKAVIARERNRLDSTFVKTHPASLVSLKQVDLMSNAKEDRRLARQLLAALTPTLRESDQGRKISARLATPEALPLAVGVPAPDFILATPDGRTVALRDYRGQYVLVDFWASWCGPCRAENPNVARVYEEFKARRFAVLGVSIDAATARAKWLKAVADDHLPWTQVLDSDALPGNAAARYYVQAIPQNFLVDPTGTIVALNLRGEALRTAVARFIK